MPDNFGLKIGIEGEKEFKKALSDINQSFKVLGSEMKLVNSQFDKNDDSVEAMTAKNKVLNKQIDEQKNKIGVLESALKQSAAQYGENDIRTQKWAVELNNAKAKLNNLAREVENNEKAMNGLGEETNKLGNELDESGDKLDNFGAKMSKIGGMVGTAITAIAAAAAAAGAALVGSSVSGAAYADDIMTLSDVTGVATDELQKFRYMTELVDVSEETLHKSMAKNIKSMAAAADGSKTAANAYSKLGVEVKNADGSLRDGQDVYWETIDALGKIDNETERDAIAMELLGKSAQDLNPLIKAGSETMKEYGEEAAAAGYVLSQETLEAFGAFDNQLQYLKVNAEGAKNALGTALLPVLTQLATDGNELLKEFTSSIRDANGDFAKIGETIGSTLASLVNKTVERLPDVINAGMSIIGALGQGILSNLPAIVGAGLEIILTLVAGIADSLPELIPAIVNTVIMIVETLIENVDKLIDASIAIVIALANGLVDSLPILIEKAPSIIAKLVAAIIENAPQLIAAAMELNLTLAKGLISSIGQLISAAGEVVSRVLGALKNGFKSAVDVGKGIVDGIWNGIKAGWDWLVTSVQNLAKSLLNGVKSVLGIHSPSRVFRDEVGAMMAEGIGEGFTDQMKKVSQQMNASIPRSFDANPTITATTKMGEGIVNGMAALMGVNHGGTIILQTVLDGKVIAQSTFDPLKSIARQRGVAFG